MRKVAALILKIKETRLELFARNVRVRSIIGKKISKFINVKIVHLELALEAEQ
jgi:hypothetical protein